MKHLSILGSTGSIGCNALRIVEMFPDRFRVTALAAKSNLRLLARQIQAFTPETAAVFDEYHARALKKILPAGSRVRILHGEAGYSAAAADGSVDMVLTAVVGAAGLIPTLAAIDAGKEIALANKETLVMAGELVMKRARDKGVNILPVDSEHSAIFQCLAGHRRQDLEKIILTASGGPFRKTPRREFARITPENALNHPTWKMGPKISIDSATLMNKGLEVIEAKWLFDVPASKIQVVVHPQSLVHSMVAYKDGAMIAQLSTPDMRGAIAYALAFPERLNLNQPPPDLAAIGNLAFEAPDMEKFPCLALAFRACETGETLPAVLNAANEVAVAAFLEKRIVFDKIPQIIQETMDRHQVVPGSGLEDILAADGWAREYAGRQIK